MQAISDFELPWPDWLICDVGTSLLQRQPTGDYLVLDQYQQHQSDIITDVPISTLQMHLASVDGLQLQEEEKQGRCKLSYYVVGASTPRDSGPRAAIPRRCNTYRTRSFRVLIHSPAVA